MASWRASDLVSESQDKTSASKYEIVLVKHLPAKTAYTPADRIIVRHGWNPGDGLDYETVYRDLNDFSAQAIREWNNPLTSSESSTKAQPSSTPSRPTPPLASAKASNQQQTTSPST